MKIGRRQKPKRGDSGRKATRPRELPPEVQDLFRHWGAQGGKAAAQHRTPEERRAAVVKAIKARWKRYREAKDQEKRP